MGEMKNIAAMVKEFPPNAQEVACNQLIAVFLNDAVPEVVSNVRSASTINSAHESSLNQTNDAARDYVAEIKDDVEQFELHNRGDGEFAAYAAHYFIHRAPAEHRSDTITKDHLQRTFSIASRKPPKKANYSNTLQNGKKKGFLETATPRGHYKLSDEGKYHVENVMLKAES